MNRKHLIALAFSCTLGIGCGPGEPGVGSPVNDDFDSERHRVGDPHEVQNSAQASATTSALALAARVVLAQTTDGAAPAIQVVHGANGTATVRGAVGAAPDVAIAFDDFDVRIGAGTMTLSGELRYRRASASSGEAISLAADQLDVEWSQNLVSDTITLNAQNVSNQPRAFSGHLTSSSGKTFTF